MQVFILGGTGFVGSYLYELLGVDFQVKASYNSAPALDLIHFKVGETRVADVVSTDTTVLVNNINPDSLSYQQVASFAEEVAQFCQLNKIHLVQISSVSACYENRLTSSYCLKKAIFDDILLQQLNNTKLTVLRFPQLIDHQGLARKSQPGVYYLMDAIRSNSKVSLHQNYLELKRNFLPIQLAASIVSAVIVKNIYGVHNALLDKYTLTITELIQLFANCKGVNVADLTEVGELQGVNYFIPQQSEAIAALFKETPDLVEYLKEAYESIS